MCANCCRGPGFVRLQADEIDRIAAFLHISRDEFLRRFTRTPEIKEHAARGDLWLLDKPGPAQECIFLADNRCSIHDAKPDHCVGFPTRWRTPDVMDYCEGMRK